MISVSQVAPAGAAFVTLRSEASGEGYLFIDRLEREWMDGTHRFARAGEALFGVFSEAELIAIGGLVRDPYAADRGIGRVRHVYVRPGWRGQGVGTTLMEAVVRHARGGFRLLHLRAHDSRAALFYERLGFTASADPQATHQFEVNGESWTTRASG